MSNDQSFKNRKPAMGKAEPGTIKRIFSYIFQYKWRVIAIVVCILVGAAAQAGSALFLQSLIDTYILPMVGESNPDWAPLLRAISLMACLYVAGIVAHGITEKSHPQRRNQKNLLYLRCIMILKNRLKRLQIGRASCRERVFPLV